MFKSKKVIVSGATGFIGQHLIPILLKDGYEVLAISRNRKKAKSLPWFKDVKFVSYDFHSDQQITEVEGFRGLIHLAWQDLPNYDSSVHLKKNLPYSYQFIESLINKGVNQVLIAGTCFEYGLKSGAISSSSTTEPTTLYATAKDTLRKKLASLSSKKDFNLQWARLFYMFGKGQNSNSIISQLDFAIKNKQKVFRMSGGEQIRDYLPVEKAAEKLFYLYKSGNKGIFNICSGKPISIRNLVESYIEKKNSNIIPKYGYYPYSVYEPMQFWGIQNI
jgi:dTDP-6-deoxy-L-talose 4-dehydrogenase (NAD+)